MDVSVRLLITKENVGLTDQRVLFALNGVSIMNQRTLMNDGETIFPRFVISNCLLLCRSGVERWCCTDRKIIYDIQRES